MPRKVPEKCLTCDAPSESLGRCSRCYGRFRRQSPEGYRELRAKTSAERAVIIRAQRRAKAAASLPAGVPDMGLNPVTRRWEYEGDSEGLARMCEQNSDESKTENQTGIEKRTSEIARNAN